MITKKLIFVSVVVVAFAIAAVIAQAASNTTLDDQKMQALQGEGGCGTCWFPGAPCDACLLEVYLGYYAQCTSLSVFDNCWGYFENEMTCEFCESHGVDCGLLYVCGELDDECKTCTYVGGCDGCDSWPGDICI